MPKGVRKNKIEGLTNSVFLIRVEGENTFVTRMPLDEENDDGETLVRNSAQVVNTIADAILRTAPEAWRSRIEEGFKRDVRQVVWNTEPFQETVVVVNGKVSKTENVPSIETPTATASSF